MLSSTAMDELKKLVERIGVTEAANRAAIEYGPALLPALEALVADTAVDKSRRMTASRIASAIRDRDFRAPPAAASIVVEDGEARGYFTAGGRLASDGFHAAHEPLEYVNTLYAAGALTVHVQQDCLVVELPHDPVARRELFALYNAEVDRFDQDFGGEQPPGHEITAAEAAALGDPSAEGEWMATELHIADTGQLTLTFWWD